ncbi:SGNH/GDSL hydrolase family protein [Microbacterium sp. TPD7012]|uniref:SGNH/GDSL hydrolase family protein n=1 Tax=Microbacterium sp. TPD7012 TaxID=2171975 RepID=UPI00140342A5|nr:SGNH/GDSL hydrolase family protein [Microbacterium sp. TPD7012]
MFTYVATDERFRYEGAPGLRRRNDGTVEVRRIPETYWHQFPSEVMKLVCDTSAGARIRFRTSATRIEVQFSAHQIATVGSGFPHMGMQLIRGDRVSSYSGQPPLASLDPGDRSVVYDPPRDEVAVFDNLGGVEDDVELLLPNGAVVNILGFRADAEIVASATEPGPHWIHYGSSISHCSSMLEPLSSWPVVAARRLGLSLCNLGFAGNAMLDPFVARTIRDAPADVITLKIGINLINSDAMTLRAFGPALHGFLDTIREGHPTTPVLLVSPIACSAVEELPGPTIVDASTGTTSVVPIDDVRGTAALTQSRIRTLMEQIVKSRNSIDAQLTYLDGRSLFSEADEASGHLSDGLHPDLVGNQIMGERFVAMFRDRRVLKRTPASQSRPSRSPG